MTLEQKLSSDDILKRNIQTLWSMQLWYLRNRESLEEIGYGRAEAQEYYIQAIHPQDAAPLRFYQLHLDFYRGGRHE